MMLFTDFKSYIPGNTENSDLNIGYLISAEGADWYECQEIFSNSTMKVVFYDNGVILSFSLDVSKLWPIGASITELKIIDIPSDLDVSGKWIYSDGEIIPAPVNHAVVAQKENTTLLAAASGAIAPLQDAVEIGMATDEEQNLLLELKLKKYRVLFNRIDPSKVPDIQWPSNPFLPG